MLRVTYLEITTTHNVDYIGKIIPKGAMMGEDTRSMFICMDYKVKKEGYNKGKPVLSLWRYENGLWHPKYEASATTEFIIHTFYENEDYCVIDKSRWVPDLFKPARNAEEKMLKSLRIVKAYGFKYYEKELPKGAMYGEDDKGIFVCTDYRVKGRGYINGKPCLKIWRPLSTTPFYDVELHNTTKWVANIEANTTTEAILSKYMVNEEICQIDWSNQMHSMAKKQSLRPTKYMAYKRNFNQYESPDNKPATSLAYKIKENNGRYI